MNNFKYRKAEGPEEAAGMLARERGAQILAGGTDLLPLMKEEIASPDSLIDLSAWRNGNRIEEKADGLRIGAMTTLASLARDETVRRNFGALADACGLAAAPQLRSMGTIGGNLLQQTRCWYYRGPFDCWLKGGEKCFARDGENEQHAIFHTAPGDSICVSAHPSDPAAALIALGAEVEYVSAQGAGRKSIEKLYRLPSADSRSIWTLPEGAVLTGVVLPVTHGARTSIYRKTMPRAAWSFALAGVAIALETDGDFVTAARVGLSGVAPIPIRAREVEELLSGSNLNDVDLDAATKRLVADAEPLSQNGYKVELLQGLFRQTFNELTDRRTL
jgi:xanthine dehydrogenase YagS FAD-binding subunit